MSDDRQQRRHDDIRENLPAFALGGLSPEEAGDVRDHLQRGCEECRRDLAVLYAPAAHALNLAPPDVPLPSGARERFLERLRASNVRALPTAMPASTSSEARRSGRRRPPRRLPWALAAAALLAAVLIGGFSYGQNRALSGEVASKQSTIDEVVDLMERADLRVEDLQDTAPPLSETRVRVYAAREGDVGMFVFDRLPPLPEGRVYQLWVGSEDDLSSAGTFTPTDAERGSYHKLLSPPDGFDRYEYVAVAVVPEGGLQEAPPTSDPAWVFRAEVPPSAQASLGP